MNTPKLDMVEIAREVLGVPKAPIMELGDEIRNLRAENLALAERLRQTPDMLGIVGELRRLNVYLVNRDIGPAKGLVEDLLRRIDRESEGQ